MLCSCRALYTSEESCQIQFIFTHGNGNSAPHKERKDLHQISLEDDVSWLIYGGPSFFEVSALQGGLQIKGESHSSLPLLTPDCDSILQTVLRNTEHEVWVGLES